MKTIDSRLNELEKKIGQAGRCLTCGMLRGARGVCVALLDKCGKLDTNKIPDACPECGSLPGLIAPPPLTESEWLNAIHGNLSESQIKAINQRTQENKKRR